MAKGMWDILRKLGTSDPKTKAALYAGAAVEAHLPPGDRRGRGRRELRTRVLQTVSEGGLELRHQPSRLVLSGAGSPV
jgi:hypothetical protein